LRFKKANNGFENARKLLICLEICLKNLIGDLREDCIEA
jgi:hypothetical protein